MAGFEEKHEAREQAHEAGIKGASKLSEQDAKEAVREVRSGADPQQAKEQARND